MNNSYDGARVDLLEFAGSSFDNALVVDFGCYRGSNANYLKEAYSGVYYVGVENDREAIEKISPCVDEVIEMDLDRFDGSRVPILARADVVILGDVVEHLKRPDLFLSELSRMISADTLVLVSVPNIQFYETFFLLMVGRFPRRERGIFDKTHLRWFTRREFLRMIEGFYEVLKFKRMYRLVDRVSRVNRLTRIVFPFMVMLAPFFTFQMYFALRKK